MNKKILIVEDDDDIQEIVKTLLMDEGYMVETAGNGQEALHQLRASVTLPALIILDLMMPVMTGYQFRQEQELDPRLAQIPVVVTTAGGNFDSKKPLIKAQAFLKKPLSIDDLLSTIKRFVEPG